MVAGEDATETDPRKIAMSSAYTMLKYHANATGTVTINAGGTTGSVDIAHSLGYIPSFIAYCYGTDPWVQQLENMATILPINESIKTGNPAIHAYATSTNIHIDVVLPEAYNQYTYYADQIVGYEYDSYYYLAGNHDGSGRGTGYHFPEIDIDHDENLVEAFLAITNVITTSGSNIKFKTYGIDQPNTGIFSDILDAESKPRTSTVNTKTQSAITSPFTYGDDVTTIIEEIATNAEWMSGNDIGLLFQDNGTDTNKAMMKPVSDDPNTDVTLKITRSGSISFDIRVIIFKDKIST